MFDNAINQANNKLGKDRIYQEEHSIISEEKDT